ncbi:hypothetical protein [Rhodoferax sediminis]|jgi:hypothetical protein|uniref:Uncharacterized protein n=1 Tax=Rhodoferax sediminis TaxID=2509614 RepID=A0A515DCX4_9BURK|nr:hypothetical protein [Rhodoferax sediminis]QDL38239.1 hypothetical protein EUB48_13795 [Rhodoferax sediminis]
MAIGWLTALKTIPWADVISTAPIVVDGAKKLWSSVGKKPAPPELAPAASPPVSSPEAQAIAALETRIAALEVEASDLHGQMVASSELIKALAEQNTQLISRIETSRVRLLWLAVANVVIAVIAVGALGLAIVRQGA